MDKFYDHKKIEKKWQDIWEKNKVFRAEDNSKQTKYYALCMFPYPSAKGLHVGHPESYTAADIIARRKRLQGYNVLNPIGWDAFGLPAENYAIKEGVPPWETTQKSIATFRRQVKSFGFSYDWDREIDTSDPDYYRWTQWMFLQMYKHGLAYKQKAKVNWCSSCQTVLANEQVINGRCERCKNEVVQKDLEQWFFRVTKYAEELLNDLDALDWPQAIKLAQKNWIGKSQGALIKFPIKDSSSKIEVFTTRPDTLYGATYIVLAPEHKIISEFKDKILNFSEVENYIKQARKKSDLERQENKEKTGKELKGVKAINPVNGEEIPIFVADYVLASYGTGAIMAVPAHDERDFDFAKDFNLPVKQVIEPLADDELYNNFYSPGSDYSALAAEKAEKSREEQIKKMRELLKNGQGCYIGKGNLVNSGEFDGLFSEEAKEKITKKAGGEMTVQYKLRDWLISRQRYWGAPIPIIYCEDCGEVPVEEKDLPVLLPWDVDFKPTGESPLASSKEFHQVKCPKCGRSARREADTMDTFVCSSWYFLRYTDPKNDKEPFSQEKVSYWLPVDFYTGGAEHAVLHLLYSRFFTKALRDMGYLKFSEPFLRLRNQGMILGEDGQKMSKSRGNVINPDEVVEEYGADTMRLYEMFMGPYEDAKPWSTKGIIGVRRFLEKLWLVTSEWLENGRPEAESDDLERLFHKTFKKVTEDIDNFKFNTAISAMMILVNQMAKEKKFKQENLQNFLIIFSTFAPHIAEEIWSFLGLKGLVCQQDWPNWDESKCQDKEIEVVVQINGKVRGKLKVPADAKEDEIFSKAESIDNVAKHIAGREIIKKIYVPGRLISLVIK